MTRIAPAVEKCESWDPKKKMWPSVFNGTGLEPNNVTVADRPNKSAESPKVGFRDVWSFGRCSEWKAKLGGQVGIVLFAGLQVGISTWVLLVSAHELIRWFEKQHRRATVPWTTPSHDLDKYWTVPSWSLQPSESIDQGIIHFQALLGELMFEVTNQFQLIMLACSW